MGKAIIGFILGGITGFLVCKIHEDRLFEEKVDDIYNNAYSDARQEMQKQEGKENIKDKEEHTRLVNQYQKPDLKDLVVKESDIAFTEEADFEELEEGQNGLINEHDFLNSCSHYRKTDIFYYTMDDVFTDEEDQILEEDDVFVSYKSDILHLLKKDDRVYLRNADFETDFEIYKLNQAYNDMQFETPIERSKRVSKRKFKSEE